MTIDVYNIEMRHRAIAKGFPRFCVSILHKALFTKRVDSKDFCRLVFVAFAADDAN